MDKRFCYTLLARSPQLDMYDRGMRGQVESESANMSPRRPNLQTYAEMLKTFLGMPVILKMMLVRIKNCVAKLILLPVKMKFCQSSKVRITPAFWALSSSLRPLLGPRVMGLAFTQISDIPISSIGV